MRLFPKIAFVVISLLIALKVTYANENAAPLYQKIENQGHQIHIWEIDPTHYTIKAVKAGNEILSRETVSFLAHKLNALGGINGGFFHEDGAPAGALKIQGQWLGQPLKPRAAIGWNENSSEVLIDKIVTDKKTFTVIPQLDKSPKTLKAWQNFNYIVGGTPLIIKNGKTLTNYHSEMTLSSFLEDRHARTAICIKKNHHWLFVVASHTKEGDRAFAKAIIEGLTIKELSDLLQTLGCEHAINLDGGGSSTLVINDQVMNYPAGDREPLINEYYERPVGDAIMVFAK